MPAAFPRTLAALRAREGHGHTITLLVAFAILAAWLAWSVLVEVPVYRSSRHARMEVAPAPARVASLASGRITNVHLALGTSVTTGDVLVELDSELETLAVTKARALVEALTPQLASIDRELRAEDAAQHNGAAADLGAERELLERQRGAESELAIAEQEYAREKRLAAAGASTESAREKAEASVTQRRAALEAMRHEVEALSASHRERGDSRRVRVEQLRRAAQELEESLSSARADVSRHEQELERRTIRAPVTGTLGEVAPLRPGSVLQAGDVVATVVPDGKLQIVAEYDAAAFGRLGVGQPARVRVDGFPWTRYGTLGARVIQVGSELRDGVIRVELELVEERATVPVRHGMTGTVDIEVERASPAVLLLRAVGEGLDGSVAR